jgi:hypothetical protein
MRMHWKIDDSTISDAFSLKQTISTKTQKIWMRFEFFLMRNINQISENKNFYSKVKLEWEEDKLKLKKYFQPTKFELIQQKNNWFFLLILHSLMIMYTLKRRGRTLISGWTRLFAIFDCCLSSMMLMLLMFRL